MLPTPAGPVRVEPANGWKTGELRKPVDGVIRNAPDAITVGQKPDHRLDLGGKGLVENRPSALR